VHATRGDKVLVVDYEVDVDFINWRGSEKLSVEGRDALEK
jgi:hypothetical protein